MIMKRWVLGIGASITMAVGAMGVEGPVGAVVGDAEAAALSGGCFGLKTVTCNGADGGCVATTCVGSTGKSGDNDWNSTTLCGSGCGSVWTTTPNTCGA